MSLVLDDLPRDPDRLLQHLRRMTEVITQQNASLVSWQAKHDTVLAERDAAQAEIEKLPGLFSSVTWVGHRRAGDRG